MPHNSTQFCWVFNFVGVVVVVKFSIGEKKQLNDVSVGSKMFAQIEHSKTNDYRGFVYFTAQLQKKRNTIWRLKSDLKILNFRDEIQ